jgi:nicotinamidase-related amidase
MAVEVFGKTVLNELSEWIDPALIAVLVIDMQNDFCHRDGAGAQRGRDYRAARSIIPAIAGILAGAREIGAPIFYCMNTQRADGSLLSPAEIGRRMKKSGGDPLLWTIDGSWGHQVVDELAPQAGDHIIRKHRPSAFYQTDLEMLLRLAGRQSVIVTGVGTRGCVESTAREAQSRDFYILIPSDTTASQRPEWYAASFVLAPSLSHYTGLATEITKIWSGRSRLVGAA